MSSYGIKGIPAEHPWITQAYAAGQRFEAKAVLQAAPGVVARNWIDRLPPQGAAPHPLEHSIAPLAPLAATPPSQAALLGTSLAAGSSLISAETAAATGRMLATAAKWGSQLFKVSPWGWAAGAAWWAYDSGALSKVASTVHALLAPPPELHGWKEEVLAVPDQSPKVHGGAPLPPALKHGAPAGYEAEHSGPTAHVFPDDGDVHKSSVNGGRTALTPTPGDHVLLKVKPVEERPGIAEYPEAPQPRMKFVDEVVVKDLDRPVIGKYFEYKFKAPSASAQSSFMTAEIKGVVVDGVMKFTVMSLGDPNLRPSGSDLVINVINALQKEGVEVRGILDYWQRSGPYSENSRRFYEALEKETRLPAQPLPDDLTFAASQTFTGKLAKQYGMSPQSVFVFSSGDVQVFFENPLHKKLFGTIRN